MTEQNSITPPPELVEKWVYEWNTLGVRHPDATNTASYVATQAARWGADQQKIRSGPESLLVERVADAIAAQATSAGIVNDRPARAAILQVAAWLREQHDGDLVAATVIEQEASK